MLLACGRPIPNFIMNHRTKWVNSFWRFLEKRPFPIYPFFLSFCTKYAQGLPARCSQFVHAFAPPFWKPVLEMFGLLTQKENHLCTFSYRGEFSPQFHLEDGSGVCRVLSQLSWPPPDPNGGLGTGWMVSVLSIHFCL